MLGDILCLIVVGALWGITNPFIKLGSRGIETIQTGSKWKNFILELRLVGTRINYWIPFLLNQFGSILYVWALQSTNLTIAVPMANSLSFVFTGITGYLLGEPLPGKKVIMGSVLICCGTTLMIYDRISQEQKAPEFNGH